MKLLWIGTLIFAAACNGKTDNNTVANPTPAPDQNPPSAYKMSVNQAFSVKIVWSTPLISESFDNSAQVYFLDKDGQALTETRLTRFYLYMASMGHPSVKENEMVLTQVAPDHWMVSRVYFSMGGSSGSWVVDLEAEANTQPDKVRVSIDHEVQ